MKFSCLAHGYVVVSSIFQPLLNQCSDNEGRAYSSYVLGFMTLDDVTSKKQGDKVPVVGFNHPVSSDITLNTIRSWFSVGGGVTKGVRRVTSSPL